MPTPRDARVELTLRGLVLGALITTVFTAANVYLGLRVGLTFASSIPAAVISMAVLKLFKGSTIWENNIVQTVASAAGTLSSVIFVLPGLVMVGWWSGFPFWATFGVCALGGVLGVTYTIPLRRALVTDSPLPYPEGVAAAEVLRMAASPEQGGSSEGGAGAMTLLVSSLASAATALVVATKLFAAEVGAYVRPTRTTATGLGGSMSLALFGVGHLVGPAVGLAFVVGLVLTWGVATPWLVHLHPEVVGSASQVASAIWSKKVRLIGAGAIGAASVWTLGKLAVPVGRGLASALRASRAMSRGDGSEVARQERDLPLPVVGLITLATLPPMAVLLAVFLHGTALGPAMLPLVAAGVLYIALAGFLVAAVCGYMAGLIGSSNSPVSGLAILSVLGAATVLSGLAGRSLSPDAAHALTAFILFVTSILLCVATIANDNLQDLKTGQLVDATPWRQQVALLVGVLAGAAVIPPILDLMNHAFGFVGANNHAIASTPLPAPQANLMSTLARGVVEGSLDWTLLGIGVAVGAVLVAADETLRRTTARLSLPPLAVALAIYLPSAITTPVIAGALLGWLFDRRADRLGGEVGERIKRFGVLAASGLIVGESIFQVFIALLITATGKGEPLAVVGEGFATPSAWLALLAFFGVPLAVYAYAARLARRS